MSSRQGVTLSWTDVSPMYPLFVATRELHAARTPHRMLSAEGMQLKHGGNTPGPSGRVCAAIRGSTRSEPFYQVLSQL